MPEAFHAVLRIFSMGQIGLHSAGLSNLGLNYTMPGTDPQAGWRMEIGDWGLGDGQWRRWGAIQSFRAKRLTHPTLRNGESGIGYQVAGSG